MSGPSGEQCTNCAFFAFQGKDAHNPSGVCSRFPRQEYKEHDDWCGEFAMLIPERPPAVGTVSDLDIDRQCVGILARKGINTLDDLCQYSREDRSDLGVGKHALDAILRALSKANYTLPR